MLPSGHVIASGIFSICVGAYFRSIGCAIVSFTAGVLLDADHFLDYFANYKFTFNVRDVYNVCLGTKLNRLYLILHSYEFVVILWAAIFILRLSNIWVAFALGYTQHLLIDQMTNHVRPLGYFLIYRMVNGFKKELIVHNLEG